MNLREIEKIIQMMNENGITEFVLEREGEKLSLKKSSPAVEFVHQQVAPYHPFAAQQSVPQQTSVQSAPKEDGNVEQEEDKNVEYICSPIVGTFYRAPAPDAEPYVKEGQHIEAGQVVCIVEAMKVMNEIKSDFAGVVEEIMVENGEPVEFGQKMFKIRRM